MSGPVAHGRQAVGGAVNVHQDAVQREGVGAGEKVVTVGQDLMQHGVLLLRSGGGVSVDDLVIPLAYCILQADGVNAHRAAPANTAALGDPSKRLFQRFLSGGGVAGVHIPLLQRLDELLGTELVAFRDHIFHNNLLVAVKWRVYTNGIYEVE